MCDEGFFIFIAPGPSRSPGADEKALKTRLLVECLKEKLLLGLEVIMEAL